MDESSEIIGSMPSVPLEEPEAVVPASRPRSDNLSTGISFGLFALCLGVFTFYVHIDVLGTGILYGMALGFLLISLLALGSGTGRKAGRQTARARRIPKRSRHLPYLNGVLLGVVLLFLSIYLLTAPGANSLSIAGLLLLLVGIIVLFLAVFAWARQGAETEEKPTPQQAERRKRSNTIMSSIVLLITSLVLLVLPQNLPWPDLDRGLCYGFSLVWLLLGLLVLCSAILAMRADAALSEK